MIIKDHTTDAWPLTVVSTAATGRVGMCLEAVSFAPRTTQPWGPRVMMTDLQPLPSSSSAARCASSTLVTEEPVSNSACRGDTQFSNKQKHTDTPLHHTLYLAVIRDNKLLFHAGFCFSLFLGKRWSQSRVIMTFRIKITDLKLNLVVKKTGKFSEKNPTKSFAGLAFYRAPN